jgi:outer membrane protein OmpA-like peptidoglycan-associated protein
MFRNLVIATTAIAVLLPGVASAQTRESPREQQRIERQRPGEPQRRGPARQVEREMPSSERILRQLDTAPRARPQQRITVQEFKRRPDLRRAAPSIEIQAINFEFGSAEIPRSQYRKVEQIADALKRLISRRPGTRILIEGHTDAVGSDASNYALSERRADSLKRVLVREFRVPARALETVGYGEQYLLVNTPYENWENRRVTLRRVDEFIR